MRRLLILPTVLLLITGAAVAQDPAPLSDTEIQRLVEQKLRGENLLTDGVEVSVDGGVVTLGGKVPNVSTKDRIIETALEVLQVKEVLSELEIAPGDSAEGAETIQEPTPSSDEQIRQLVEEKLQAEKLLKETFDVSVEAGVVTLKGKVPNVWTKDRIVAIVLEVPQAKEIFSELAIATGESDQDLAKQLAEKIRRYPNYTIHDEVTGRVEDGAVYLIGWVTMPFKSSAIEEMASKILGVQEVRNEISVLPTSSIDAKLRETLAQRIYGNSTFRAYASQVYPPIHIIVHSSRVLLTGVVNSEIEKVKAERITNSTFGVLSVENLLRVER